MPRLPALRPHPRLYIGPDQIARLRRRPTSPPLREAADRVAADADAIVAAPRFEFVGNTHNWMLIRAREMQTRVVTLITRWLATGDRRYRDCAVEQVRQMGRWKYWSWIAWRSRDAAPDAVFDLSYGENSATLALAWDLLHDSLSNGERDEMVAIARRWPVASFLRNGGPGSFWFGKADTNWNTVCAGGAGMLALAMRERLGRDADAMLARVERSIRPFFELLRKSGGAWPEGVGYWGYGFRYGFMYLLSHEQATGRTHPLMRIPQMRETVAWPLDFCPNGVSASFGDANSFWAQPIHYAAAERLGRHDLPGTMDGLRNHSAARNHWPDAAEMLLLHPRRTRRPAVRRNVARLYRGQDWAILADRMPGPSMYLSIRGGTTEVPHGHHDLLSFHCVVGDETMIVNTTPAEYLDTTFSPRRYELTEIGPMHKNAPMVNGVGIAAPCKVATRLLRVAGCPAVRIDATGAMGLTRDRRPAVRFAARLFVMIPGVGFVIVDRVQTQFPARFESRMHTQAQTKPGKAGALLVGRRQALRVAYCCDTPGRLFTAQMAPTTPTDGPVVLRWCTGAGLLSEATLVTLLAPGRAAAKVELLPSRGGTRLRVERGRKRRTLDLTARLQPR
ncbi:MAG: hypothetical protein BIFFINMI_03429 [Phycisphaerae bacterium]|nr:hypothetical protein [Phycisphaerae bacterium]